MSISSVSCSRKMHRMSFKLAMWRMIDNNDHNPSSTTSKGSLNGSSISFYQMTSFKNSGYMITKTLFMDGNKLLHVVPELMDSFALLNKFILACKLETTYDSQYNILTETWCFLSYWRGLNIWIDCTFS